MFFLLFLDCRCWPFWWRWRRGSVGCTTWHVHFPALFAGDVGGGRFSAHLLLLILCVFSLLWITLRWRCWGYWLWYNLLCCFVFFFLLLLEDIGLEQLSIKCHATEWSLSLWWTKERKYVWDTSMCKIYSIFLNTQSETMDNLDLWKTLQTSRSFHLEAAITVSSSLVHL